MRNGLTKIASVFGILSGIGGLIHGVGEVLQGNVAPEGLIINSWTEGPIAEHMGGEPGMTIIPNLLVTGVLTILVSTALIVWSARYAERKHTGKVILALSILMLLFGGGFGPPTMGLMAGMAGSASRRELRLWKKTLPHRVIDALSGVADWTYLISAINGVFLVFGSATFAYMGIHAADLFVGGFFLTLVTIPAAIITGIARKIRTMEDQPQAVSVEAVQR